MHSYHFHNRSGYLEPLKIEISSFDGKPLYSVREQGNSYAYTFLRWLKFRTLFTLILEIKDLRGELFLKVKRPGGFYFSPRYEVFGADRSPIAHFRRKVVGLKNIPLFYSPGTMEIVGPGGILLGTWVSRNITLIGTQRSTLMDRQGLSVGELLLNNFSIWKGYKHGLLTLHREDPPWFQLALAAALIRFIILHQR